VTGSNIIPIHSTLRNKEIVSSDVEELSMASAVNMTTTHMRIIANARATRSRKLNEREYKNNENAVMAIPAVKI
jgi:hypothetical protein